MPDAHARSGSGMSVAVVLLDIGGVLTPDPWETILLTREVGLVDRLGLDRELARQAGERLFRTFAVRADAEEAAYWGELGSALGLELPPAVVAATEAALLTPNPQVEATLRELASRGIGVGSISNTTSFWFPKQAALTGLDRVADEQLLFLSFRYGVTKEDVPGLFDIARRTVEPRDTLVVDDREEQARQAAVAGFRVLRYGLESGRALLREIERAGSD